MKELIDTTKIPQHVAVIMDGNGRWAKQKGAASRVFGHQNAVKAVREVTEAAGEIGVKYLTLYAFSTENWSRPESEVSALMTLLVSTIRKEIKSLMENNVKLHSIGNLALLPEECRNELTEAIRTTAQNTGLNVVLALSYSGRWELAEAMKTLALQVKEGSLQPEDISEQTLSQALGTANIPDPELLIRTSGEMRISNFLLWQIAYAELFFTNVLWPDFRKEHFFQAILAYQQRERRFGKISEQIGS